jgi:hypothetical protein
LIQLLRDHQWNQENTITNADCEKGYRIPNAQIEDKDPSGVANGYLCSNAFKHQMNAIVGACSSVPTKI